MLSWYGWRTNIEFLVAVIVFARWLNRRSDPFDALKARHGEPENEHDCLFRAAASECGDKQISEVSKSSKNGEWFHGAVPTHKTVELIFSFCLVLVGFLQWWVYRNQAAIMAAQANISSRQLNAQIVAQRPIIHLSEPVATELNQYIAVKPTGIRPYIINDGQTAPTSLLVQSDCSAIGRFELTKPAETIPLAPKEKVAAHGCIMPAETVVSFTKEGGKYYVFGRIEYRDSFGTPYLTEYCRELNYRPISSNPQASDSNFCQGAMAKYNCLDQGCEDWRNFYPTDYKLAPAP